MRARVHQAGGQGAVVVGAGAFVQRGQAQHFAALRRQTAHAVDQQVFVAAFVKVADDDDDGAARRFDQARRVAHGFGNVGAAAQLHFHQRFHRLMRFVA